MAHEPGNSRPHVAQDFPKGLGKHDKENLDWLKSPLRGQMAIADWVKLPGSWGLVYWFRNPEHWSWLSLMVFQLTFFEMKC